MNPSITRVVTTTSQTQLDADEQIARQLANEDSSLMDIDEYKAREIASAALTGMSDDDNDNDSSSSPAPESSSSNKSTSGPSNQQQGIDINTLKTRKRQESARAKQEKRHGYKYGNQIETFRLDQIVTITVPKKDRPTSSSPRQLFARIIKRSGHQYQLQTVHGIVNRMYTPTAIQSTTPFLAKANPIPDNPTRLSLKTIARLHSKIAADRVRCSCKKMPCSKKCGCVRVDKKCSIYCHGSDNPCGNEAEGPELRQYALLERSKPKE